MATAKEHELPLGFDDNFTHVASELTDLKSPHHSTNGDILLHEASEGILPDVTTKTEVTIDVQPTGHAREDWHSSETEQNDAKKTENPKERTPSANAPSGNNTKKVHFAFLYNMACSTLVTRKRLYCVVFAEEILSALNQCR